MALKRQEIAIRERIPIRFGCNVSAAANATSEISSKRNARAGTCVMGQLRSRHGYSCLLSSIYSPASRYGGLVWR
jgi:hypothetical protein